MDAKRNEWLLGVKFNRQPTIDEIANDWEYHYAQDFNLMYHFEHDRIEREVQVQWNAGQPKVLQPEIVHAILGEWTHRLPEYRKRFTLEEAALLRHAS